MNTQTSKNETGADSAPVSAWAKSNALAIERAIESRYGKGWRACFPGGVQDALVRSEVLGLILTQAMDKYGPAQELIREILPALEK